MVIIIIRQNDIWSYYNNYSGRIVLLSVLNIIKMYFNSYMYLYHLIEILYIKYFFSVYQPLTVSHLSPPPFSAPFHQPIPLFPFPFVHILWNITLPGKIEWEAEM